MHTTRRGHANGLEVRNTGMSCLPIIFFGELTCLSLEKRSGRRRKQDNLTLGLATIQVLGYRAETRMLSFACILLDSYFSCFKSDCGDTYGARTFNAPSTSQEATYQRRGYSRTVCDVSANHRPGSFGLGFFNAPSQAIEYRCLRIVFY
jgi:hypothetical protein